MERLMVWAGFALTLWAFLELFIYVTWTKLQGVRIVGDVSLYAIHWTPFVLFVLYILGCLVAPSETSAVIRMVDKIDSTGILWFVIGIIVGLTSLVPEIFLLLRVDEETKKQKN